MRSLKSTVSRYYPFYCAQVNQLLEVQKQLHAVLLGSPKGGSEATVVTPGSPGGGSAASLRTLLGKAVRAQTEHLTRLRQDLQTNPTRWNARIVFRDGNGACIRNALTAREERALREGSVVVESDNNFVNWGARRECGVPR